MIAAMAALRPEPARTGPPSRFEPRTVLDAAIVPVLNRLARRRAPFRATVEGLALEIGPVRALSALPAAPPEAIELHWAVGDLRLSTVLPLGTVEQIGAALQPDLIDLPDEPALSLLLELALSPLLETAERLLGRRCSVLDTCPADADRGGFASAGGSLAGVPFTILLRAAPADVPAVLDLLARLCDAAPALPTDQPFPIRVAVRVGALALPLSALSAVRPGDALIPDRFPLARNEAVIAVGGRHAATAKIDGKQARLLTPLQRVPPSEEVGMAQTDVREAGALDDVDVELVFELGRQTVEVGELRALAPGAVIPLGRDPASPIDILANGRRVGLGEIVKVGETLGVRVLRIFGEG